ncbi:uncharacterized protein LOC100890560 [Strongylocentrotus purpuratus]|uniref:Uncharacterized protein n=1 Tax=Strongylocentrotus purpuratus TaxID=7668 RepID=A0A7M7GQ85_STRPU|nr:uncharacterized protein LOC100890560 [Strongylocentrotus purpuratus]
MDPVSIRGRDGRSVTDGRRPNEWNGYQWNISLDEIFDCDAAPECCQTCYYKNKRMSKKKKSLIVFLLFAISILLTALVVRYSLGTIDIIVGIGDQRPIISQDTNFSPLLCSRFSMINIPMQQNPVTLSSSSSSSLSSSNTQQIGTATSNSDEPNNNHLFDAYMLLDTPYRSYQTSSYTVHETMMFPTDDYFNYWAAHFDSGSEVTISLCPDSDVELHVMQGKSALDKVLKSHEVHGSLIHVFVPCSSFSTKSSYHFSVSSLSDDYAFIFTLADPWTSTPTSTRSNNSTLVTFSFRRKELIFDEAALYTSCEDVDHCSLPVPNKARSVMIEMKQNATAWPMTIRTECVPSIGMYFAFFLGIPAGIIVVLGACGGVLYLCQKSVMDDIERAECPRRPQTSVNRSSSSSSPNTVSTNGASSGSMARITATRRAFRTTMSARAPLVDHDVLSAMAEVNRQYDLPPTYNEVEHVSSPVDERPPPSFEASQNLQDVDPPSFEATQNLQDDDPPSYESIMT